MENAFKYYQIAASKDSYRVRTAAVLQNCNWLWQTLTIS